MLDADPSDFEPCWLKRGAGGEPTPTVHDKHPARTIAVSSWNARPTFVMANRNLHMLVIGQFISAVGDQFYLIAMPWLALDLTGSGLVAGTVLAAASLPRALFMLVGGSATDRFSAKTLLVTSNGLQGVLMAVLGITVLASFTPLWLLYLMGFLTGLVDAFGIPAFNSMLPQVVPDHELERGNIYLQGANMTSGIIGPALAGALIAATSLPTVHGDLAGVGTAFLVDAATYLVGISFFMLMVAGASVSDELTPPASLVGSLRDLGEYLRTDPRLRKLLGLMMVLGLFLTGTIRVGFPLLAERQFAGGAQAFGWLTSSLGAGMLGGMAIIGLGPRPREERAGTWILGLTGAVPAGLITLGTNRTLPQSLAVIFAMGLALGYVLIYLLSWLQRHTPTELIGRVMSVAMFATIGLSPVSQAMMGAIFDINLPVGLIAVGIMVLIVLVLAAADRRLWDLSGSPNRSRPAA
jgi:MFS family permease